VVGCVGNLIGIEDDYIRPLARPKVSAAVQPKYFGGLTGGPANRVGHREQLSLSHVHLEYSWECAASSRMRFVGGCGLSNRAVAAEQRVGLNNDVLDVSFIHVAVHRLRPASQRHIDQVFDLTIEIGRRRRYLAEVASDPFLLAGRNGYVS